MSNSDSNYCISIDDVQNAARRIKGTAHETPVLTARSLSSDYNLYFKVEALQKTGSFKFRGALNAIRSAIEEHGSDESKMQLQVVTHSSGNHAQAVALAAKLSCTDNVNVKATLCMPENTPSVKLAAVQGYGGHIIMTASTNEAREEAADKVVADTGAFFVHPSEDPRVIAGQGTVCLEMITQVQSMGSSLDAVIIPVGGGGLASGNCVTLRAMLGDKVKIILAEPQQLDDAYRSFYSGQLCKHATDNKLSSVADGLKTTLGPNTWPIVRDHTDDIYVVSEREILKATKLVWERLKICIEPSAGVGVAVALYNREFKEKYPPSQYPNVGVILCGGNVDVLKVTATMQLLGL